MTSASNSAAYLGIDALKLLNEKSKNRKSATIIKITSPNVMISDTKVGTFFRVSQAMNGENMMARIIDTTSMFTKPAKVCKMRRETPKLAAPIRKRNVREKFVV